MGNRKPLVHFEAVFPKQSMGGYGPVEFGREIPSICIQQVGKNHLTGTCRFVVLAHPDRRDHIARLQGIIRKDNMRIVRCLYDVGAFEGVGSGDLDGLVGGVDGGTTTEKDNGTEGGGE